MDEEAKPELPIQIWRHSGLASEPQAPLFWFTR
jgi:hypothetical protein